jgi:hypothetical protein
MCDPDLKVVAVFDATKSAMRANKENIAGYFDLLNVQIPISKVFEEKLIGCLVLKVVTAFLLIDFSVEVVYSGGIEADEWIIREVYVVSL